VPCFRGEDDQKVVNFEQILLPNGHMLAFAGLLATVVIGFGWGGWTLGGTAREAAAKSAAAAVVAVLAPMCADKFRQAADASANMTEIKKVSSWMQDSYIEKGGWATFPGMTLPDRDVARARATLLTAL
jgi:predicted negative regulator of RcsB-dependent stress response